MSDDTQPSYGNKPGLANKYFYLEILNSQITLPLSSFFEKLLSGFERLSMYCLHTSVSHLIPCHRKYSQSESRKTVVYLMVLYPTFPKCAAILLPPKFSKRRRFPSSMLEVLFSDFLAISEQNYGGPQGTRCKQKRNAANKKGNLQTKKKRCKQKRSAANQKGNRCKYTKRNAANKKEERCK